MSARLDAELADRGLARSRSNAARLIADGRVRVDGRVAEKPSLRVTAEQVIEVDADHYVSRAAHKLIAGLDGFGIDVAGRTALDMGASTGGFTQVLLERGAVRVAAVDVGHDQLADEIRDDARVSTVEGYNVRYMTRASLAEESGIDAAPSIVTGDLSFISLSHVLPAVKAVMAADADVVLLVKPQFEVGRTGIRGGIVVDDARREAAVAGVLAEAESLGFVVHGLLPSPVEGTHGNREALLHLRADGEARDWADEIRGAVR
ncbi:TlyA family rRNA (cytidine-2'-O)-methyltransferase [Microbacterium sorbitolivorans]|uniref:TlyA family RNA methyltransferase n=1 Tax=Microbacterium sorbitolivorans TaxID=1867410 RepID=A0A367Y7R7_9MICO|nr:TlyA family RNA methyltransferase [Microbacterium sorbitolivorans]RCK61092.1 TlyA family RNA methyltransferase [Microbacterium sorbitolivorans]GGF35202.1 TlyA family rRNA (cytidine-2'-O)-methyltransferase [Microbacterium sorbitolivorans]